MRNPISYRSCGSSHYTHTNTPTHSTHAHTLKLPHNTTRTKSLQNLFTSKEVTSGHDRNSPVGVQVQSVRMRDWWMDARPPTAADFPLNEKCISRLQQHGGMDVDVDASEEVSVSNRHEDRVEIRTDAEEEEEEEPNHRNLVPVDGTCSLLGRNSATEISCP